MIHRLRVADGSETSTSRLPFTLASASVLKISPVGLAFTAISSANPGIFASIDTSDTLHFCEHSSQFLSSPVVDVANRQTIVVDNLSVRVLQLPLGRKLMCAASVCMAFAISVAVVTAAPVANGRRVFSTSRCAGHCCRQICVLRLS